MSNSDSHSSADLFSSPHIGLGVDIVEISRIERLIGNWGDRFTNRIFTAREQKKCSGKFSALAVRFAAKEAFVKAMGTGLWGMTWLDIEILNHPNGRPYYVLHGGAASAFSEGMWKSCALSLSHTAGMAIAMAVANKQIDTSG